MRILRTWGFGSKKILANRHTTTGTVTAVKTCWWLKLNAKPVRSTPLDGAKCPHVFRFTYQVDGHTYEGSHFTASACPRLQEQITVHFDPEDPSKYAVAV